MNSDTSLDINNHSNPVQTVAQPKEDNEMLRATDKITALYCRLSVEDTKDEKKYGKEDLSIPSKIKRLCCFNTHEIIAFPTRHFSLMTATAV